MSDFISEHKKLVIICLIAFVLVILVAGYRNHVKELQAQEEAQKQQELLEQAQEEDYEETSDSLIMMMQDDLISTYGKLPEGYLWDMDGTLLSQGDKTKTAEEVVYAYMNGLQTLDMSMVQKYSRNSMVISTYSGYFDETNRSTDYTDSFIRNMYRDCLLSFQVEGIVSSSVFAENKEVFTVKVNMLDLTDKAFWEKDKKEIYENLKLYGSDQSDDTKAEMYLYDYITRYYESGKAATRDVIFDLTLQKYPDLDTGWLVSIDTDVDLACKYADGTLVVNYIMELYADEGSDYLNKTGIYAEDYKGDEENYDYYDDFDDSESSSSDDGLTVNSSVLNESNVKELN